MNDYEILLMLDPEAPEGRHEEILARTRELVETGGGAWHAHEPWGRRKLAYEIDKKSEGVYHLVALSCEPATLDEISRVLKISDGVMRHMATRRLRPHRRPQAKAAPDAGHAEEYPEEPTADSKGGA